MTDFSDINPHLALWQSESASSAGELAYERWLTRAEKLLGIKNLDGDQSVDGYSLDGAYAAFEAGTSAKDYVAEVHEAQRAIAAPFPTATV